MVAVEEVGNEWSLDLLCPVCAQVYGHANLLSSLSCNSLHSETLICFYGGRKYGKLREVGMGLG